jgi:hypothetical protein
MVIHYEDDSSTTLMADVPAKKQATHERSHERGEGNIALCAKMQRIVQYQILFFLPNQQGEKVSNKESRFECLPSKTYHFSSALLLGHAMRNPRTRKQWWADHRRIDSVAF